MSDVIHATARAIDMVRRRAKNSNPRVIADRNECDSQMHARGPGINDFTPMGFSVAMARELVEKGTVDVARWPTCMACLVALDRAMEHPVESDAARESRATANAYRDALRLSAEVEADMRGGGK